MRMFAGLLALLLLTACGTAAATTVAPTPTLAPTPTPSALTIAAVVAEWDSHGLRTGGSSPAQAVTPAASASLLMRIAVDAYLAVYEFRTGADAIAYARETEGYRTRYAHRNIGLACTKGKEATACQQYYTVLVAMR